MSDTPVTPETPRVEAEPAAAAPAAAEPPARQPCCRLRRVVPVVVLVVLAAYAALAAALGLRRSVYLVDGLGVPYDVTVNGQTLSLAPGKPVVTAVREGQVTVEIQDKALGVPPVTVAVQTPFWSRPFVRPLFVLNPDGTAVLVRETLQAPTAAGAGSGPQVSGSLHVGMPLYAFPRPTLVFAPFPDDAASGKATGWTRVDLVPPDAPPSGVLQAIAENVGLEPAVLLASRRLAANPDALEYLQFLVSTVRPEGLVSLLQPGIAARPVRIEWHRVYQGARQDSGAAQDVIDEYRTMLAREPDNPVLQYLLGRVVETSAEAIHLFEQAIAAPTPCLYAYNALAHKRLGRAEFGQAADLAAQAAASLPDNQAFAFSYAQMLIAAGRHDAALAELQRLAATSVGDTGLLLDMLQVHLAQGGPSALEPCLQAWLADLQSKGAPDDVRSGIERSMRAHMAYMVGDLEGFAAAAKASGDATFAFAEALTAGRVADADTALAAVQPPNPIYSLLVAIAARRAGLAEIANRQLEATLALMRQGPYDQRTLAGWLAGDQPFASVDLDRLPLDPHAKAVFLTALGLAYPDQQADCFALARKLNYRRLFPHRLLAQVLGEPAGR